MSKRQLAAIMFTDIEGYTALMQHDEKSGVELRKRHREVFNSITEQFDGKIIQYFGDGTLSIFNSTVEAVNCAIELQKSFMTEPEIPVRIGIHVGDIISSKDDIIGDAVNVASRIESCAISGSILISDKVHDQIRSHKSIKTKFIDAFELKNVEGAMPLFGITNNNLRVPKSEDVKGKLKDVTEDKNQKRLTKKTILTLTILLLSLVSLIAYFQIVNNKKVSEDYSIAVLPFNNLSTDSDSEIFRDGMTEDILTNLSKIKELHVISRTSVMQFKDRKLSIPEIAQELGVVYILDGSIRKYGDKIRVSAKLIDAINDEHIWAENYDKTLTDIFELQSNVSKEIVEALHLNISFDEQQNLTSIPTKNIEAYQYFLRGKQEADIRTSNALTKSIELYQKAIDLDPNYAEAYAEIANSYFLEAYHARVNPHEAAKTANSYLDKAEKINDKISRIYTVRGLIYNFLRDFDKSKNAFERAIALSPNDVTARHQYSTFFYYNQRYKEQLEQAKIAYSLDPLSFATATSYFTALTYNEEFDEARKVLKAMKQMSMNKNDFIIDRSYMRLYLAMNEYKKAIPHINKIIPNESSYTRLLGYSYAKIGDTLNAYKIIDTLKLKDKTRLKNHRIAVIFAALKERDSMYYYLDPKRNLTKRFNSNRINYFDVYKTDSRYEDLLISHGIKKESK